jgi:ribosome-binding protein aMBF1 (putative translation factor)
MMKKAVQVLEDQNRPQDSDSVQRRVQLIRALEGELRTEFKDTKDFREKVGKYLAGYDLRKPEPAKRVIGGRKKLRITQLELARRLGYKSHVPIAQFERGKRYPTRRVFQWLESIGM